MFYQEISKHLKGKKIKLIFKEEVEPQEILLDALSQKEELFSKKRFEIPIKNKVTKRVSFLFFLIIFLLASKTFELQIMRGQEFLALAKRNYQTFDQKRAERGVIYDKGLNQLVFNDISFDLVCDPLKLSKDREKEEVVIKAISEIIKQGQNSLREKIEQKDSSGEILVEENLSHETLILLESKIQELPGFYIDENIKRTYADGALFSHTIGFLGRIEKEELELFSDYSPLDYIGKVGLEKSYEDILKGQKEIIAIKSDAKGKELAREKISEAKNGQSLVLWLDSELQKKSHNILEAILNKTGANAGVVVAMDPKTGGILSLVSLPSFDNNIFFQRLSQKEWDELLANPQKPFWNRVVSATYPTGSTIKPLIAVAALEENIISATKNILCEGKISIENPWYPDNPWIFNDWTVHGWTDLRKAIAQSCNVYFYTVGGGYGGIKGLGEERIKNYLELFGWGRLTGIDIPQEKAGLVPDREWKKEYFEDETQKIWLPGDTYNLSIGQGYLSITPIQVVTSFSAIANGGKLLKPAVVKEIIDEEKNVVKNFESEIIRESFVNPQNLKIVREGMRDAVIYGSSYILNNLPVSSAAKTGTAQTGRKDYYHNWVTVFAPYDDPEIVLTVIIENVPKEQAAALPVAKEILNWFFTK